jgi:hypothetical protein
MVFEIIGADEPVAPASSTASTTATTTTTTTTTATPIDISFGLYRGSSVIRNKTMYLRVKVAAKNKTSVAVKNVKYCVSIPKGWTLDKIYSNDKYTLKAGELCWNVKSLKAGATTKKLIMIRATPKTANKIVNVNAKLTATGFTMKTLTIQTQKRNAAWYAANGK